MRRALVAIVFFAASLTPFLASTAGAVAAPPPLPAWAEGPAFLGGLDSEGTLLPDGRVLAVGHFGGVSVYDPTTNRWSPAGALPGTTPLTTMANGKVLAAGGWPFNALRPTTAVSVFDPSTNAWTPTTPMPLSLSALQEVNLTDGRVLVVGVEASGTGAALIFDPVAATWTSLAAAPQAPGTPSAYVGSLTALPDGRALAVTGAMATTYVPSLDAWVAVAPLRRAHFGHTATVLLDGRVLIAGGEQHGNPAIAEVFDPRSGTWSDAGALNVPRFGAEAARLPDGRVVLAGGNGYVVSWLDATEVWDPVTATWSVLRPMRQARTEFAAVTLHDGRVMALGGAPQPTELLTFRDDVAPLVLGLGAATNPTRGDGPLAITAYGFDAVAGVASAELFVDADPIAGTGTPMTVEPPTPSVSSSVLRSSIDATRLAEGEHVLEVRAVDAVGHESDVATSTFVIDRSGPAITDLRVIPSTRLEEGRDGFLAATATDANGVTDAELFADVDPGEGFGTPVPLSAGWPSIEVTASFGRDLPLGPHTVYLRARDWLGNWSVPASVEVVVAPPDDAGPTVQALSLSPSVVTVGGVSSVAATAVDDQTGVAYAELYVDIDPTRGLGTPLTVSRDGLGASISGQLSTASLAPGLHTVFVRACDGAGNWSEPRSSILDVRPLDVTPPQVVVSPNLGVVSVGDDAPIQAVALDGQSGVASAEAFVGADPGHGRGIPLAMMVTEPWTQLSGTIHAELPAGEHTVWIRARDGAGNWSAATPTTLVVVDRSAGQVTGGGSLTTQDGTTSKVTFSFDVRYRDTQDLPQGSLAVKTPTMSLKLVDYSWLAIGPTKTSFLATTLDKDKNLWWVRFDLEPAANLVTLRVYPSSTGPDVGPAALTATGPMKGLITVHK